jgi:hypothetical protein
VTYLIEYLGEFEFIFKTVLGYVSGNQMGSFEAKKRSRKSHAWAPLKNSHIMKLMPPPKKPFLDRFPSFFLLGPCHLNLI